MIDRKTIRKYDRLDSLPASQDDLPPKFPTGQELATGLEDESGQNPPPRPPAPEKKLLKHARSACEPHREWIEEQVRLDCNSTAIYQDPVERFGFNHRYNSAKRFARGLKKKDSRQHDRLEFLLGEEAQVD